jgi:beta-lactam-binding protein with PASTA domain
MKKIPIGLIQRWLLQKASTHTVRISLQCLITFLLALTLTSLAEASVFYKFDVIAKTGQAGLLGLGSGPSINDNGSVAFQGVVTGGQSIFVGDGNTDPINITPGFIGATRTFSQTVQINNAGKVIARDQVAGAPPRNLVRIWDSKATPLDSFAVVARGTPSDLFDAVIGFNSLNNNLALENLAITGGNGDGLCDVGESCVEQSVFTAFKGLSDFLATPQRSLTASLTDPGIYNLVSVSLPLQPMIADNGKIVARAGNLPIDPIKLYENYLLASVDIATSSMGFITLGESPGISDNGKVIVFYGDLSASGAAALNTTSGPGIFASIDEGSIDGDITASRKIIRLAGTLGELGKDNTDSTLKSLTFAGYEDNRVGVIHQTINGTDTLVVTFVAAPDGACTALQCDKGLLFSNANKGLWAIRVDLNKTCVSPTAPDKALTTNPSSDDIVVGETIQAGLDKICNTTASSTSRQRASVGSRYNYELKDLVPVIQVGDKVPLSTGPIADIAIYDPITLADGKNSNNQPRVQFPGEHRIAFWARTATGNFVIRASYLDSDGDSLLDHWETDGLDIDQDGISDFDLSKFDPAAQIKPDPTKKDIYVEIDYMECKIGSCPNNPSVTHSHRPQTASIASVKTAFATAPVKNLNNATSSQGIQLHVLVDEPLFEASPLTFNARQPGIRDDFLDIKIGDNGSIPIGQPCGVTQNDGHLGTKNERSDVANCPKTLHARHLTERYGIFGQEYVSTPPGSSGVAKIGGSDFMVTLSKQLPTKDGFDVTWKRTERLWRGSSYNTTALKEQIDAEAATFMHEFGHTLGLLHGGNKLLVNYKPNYISIMNYSRQFNSVGRDFFDAFNGVLPPGSGVKIARIKRDITYSRLLGDTSLNRSLHPDLNENALVESVGIQDDSPKDRITYTGQNPNIANFVVNPTGNFTAITSSNGPIDWDLNQTIVFGTVTSDTNVVDVTPANSSVKVFDFSPNEILQDFDDWSALQYGFRNSPYFAAGGSTEIISTDSKVVEPTAIEVLNSFLAGIPDYDDDGLLNENDNCPTVSNVDQMDSNGNGFGDVCEPTGDALFPEIVTVPDIVGLPENEARLNISAVRLAVTNVTAEMSSSVAAGSVIFQSPESNSLLDVGGGVNFVVSTGNTPPVAVPNVNGLLEGDATLALINAGLTIGTISLQPNNTVPLDTVISQTPETGFFVAPGAAISLVISSGVNSAVTVPSVVNLSQADATAAITGAGLIVGTVTTATSSIVASGLVISQNPASGTNVNSGSAVDLVVSSGPTLITVPNVVGQVQAIAEAALTTAGLVVGTVTPTSSATVPAGSVISQNPAAGAGVASGSAVDLVVSSGPALITVPSVTDQPQAAAETAITGAGLIVGTVTNASSTTVSAGSVISQNPAAGTPVASGTAVDLVVSSGPALITVPNVIGQTQAAADTALTTASLVVGTITTASSATVPTGSVISQNPAAGSGVASGSAVDLVISSGPALIPVPNVVDQPQVAAEIAITGAGLVVGTVTPQSSNTVPTGSVISQNPAAGAGVAPGSAVDLVVSSGPALITVPNVIGQTQVAADRALTTAGLVVGTVTTASSTTVPTGSVISQNPAAGAGVASGSAVDLVVSSGPALITVPNVVDQPQVAAETAITGAGLVVGTVTPQSSNTVPAGSVISQNPAVGTSVASGTGVDLVVSSGPALITVPNVIGQTQAAADTALTTAGLVVGTVTTASSATVPNGSVISQNPAAGAGVASGSAVDLVVSSGSLGGTGYTFEGFFGPVKQNVLNVVEVGHIIELRFGLSGYQGMDILAPGSPRFTHKVCNKDLPSNKVEQELKARAGVLNYDRIKNQYVYTWKVLKRPVKTCGQIDIQLKDGSSHLLNFKFKK